jgi:hypothetical protein
MQKRRSGGLAAESLGRLTDDCHVLLRETERLPDQSERREGGPSRRWYEHAVVRSVHEDHAVVVAEPELGHVLSVVIFAPALGLLLGPRVQLAS